MRGVFRERDLAEQPVHVARIESLLADRMTAHHPDDLARLVGAGDVRHHDGGGVAFEGFHILAVTALVHADDRVHVMEFRGADLVFEIEPVIGHMLVAKPDRRRAGQSGQLDNAGISQVELDDGAVEAGAEFAEDAGGAEGHERMKDEG